MKVDRRFTRPLLVSATLFVCLMGSGREGAAQGSAAEVEAGRQLYMSNGCYSCHGTVGQGGERGAGPRIAPDPFPYEAFKVMVRQPRESMPRYDERFVSDAQLQAIHRYLSTIPKGRSAKDIAPLQALGQ